MIDFFKKYWCCNIPLFLTAGIFGYFYLFFYLSDDFSFAENPSEFNREDIKNWYPIIISRPDNVIIKLDAKVDSSKCFVLAFDNKQFMRKMSSHKKEDKLSSREGQPNFIIKIYQNTLLESEKFIYMNSVVEWRAGVIIVDGKEIDVGKIIYTSNYCHKFISGKKYVLEIINNSTLLKYSDINAYLGVISFGLKK